MQTIIIVALVLVALYIVFRIFKTMLKWLLFAVIIVVAIAFFSNPDDADHRKQLKDIRKDLSGKINEKDVQVDDYKIFDYKVFSLAKARVKGEEIIVGIGAFGKVWYVGDVK